MTIVVLWALVPIVILIALGAVLRQREFLADGFWSQAERLGYYVLLPCLFFHGLATARIETLPVGALALTLIPATLAVAALVISLRPLTLVDGPAFTSLFQGSVRFNNYVGVTLAAGMFGGKGIAMAAICNAAIVPTVNVLCVIVFARYGAARLTGRDVLTQMITNPLVLASLGGIAFQLIGCGLPPGIEPAMRALGAASLPLGLLCVGAALDFHTARQWIGPVAFSSVMKFLAMPVSTVLFSLLTDLKGTALTTALLFQVLPTASSAYIMARQLGGDAPLMAGIIAMQTVLALLAIPLVLIGIGAVLPL